METGKPKIEQEHGGSGKMFELCRLLVVAAFGRTIVVIFKIRHLAEILKDLLIVTLPRSLY